MSAAGLRIGNELNAFIDSDLKIRPVGDHILVKPLNWRPSAVLEVVYRGKALRGRVIAVGPGCNPRKYDGPKGRRQKVWWSRRFQPTQVKPGDIVELGGLELHGYLFPTVVWGGEEHVICREPDVVWVYE